MRKGKASKKVSTKKIKQGKRKFKAHGRRKQNQKQNEEDTEQIKRKSFRTEKEGPKTKGSKT